MAADEPESKQDNSIEFVGFDKDIPIIYFHGIYSNTALELHSSTNLNIKLRSCQKIQLSRIIKCGDDEEMQCYSLKTMAYLSDGYTGLCIIYPKEKNVNYLNEDNLFEIEIIEDNKLDNYNTYDGWSLDSFNSCVKKPLQDPHYEKIVNLGLKSYTGNLYTKYLGHGTGLINPKVILYVKKGLVELIYNEFLQKKYIEFEIELSGYFSIENLRLIYLLEMEGYIIPSKLTSMTVCSKQNVVQEEYILDLKCDILIEIYRKCLYHLYPDEDFNDKKFDNKFKFDILIIINEAYDSINIFELSPSEIKLINNQIINIINEFHAALVENNEIPYLKGRLCLIGEMLPVWNKVIKAIKDVKKIRIYDDYQLINLNNVLNEYRQCKWSSASLENKIAITFSAYSFLRYIDMNIDNIYEAIEGLKDTGRTFFSRKEPRLSGNLQFLENNINCMLDVNRYLQSEFMVPKFLLEKISSYKTNKNLWVDGFWYLIYNLGKKNMTDLYVSEMQLKHRMDYISTNFQKKINDIKKI